MSTNISNLHREELLDKIRQIRAYIASTPEDQNKNNLLQYLEELTKDVKGKKYGLVFEQHREKIDEQLETHVPVLTEDKSLFIDNGGEINFLIEGDNLAALQLLMKTHKNNIDLIYIDPPYNRGIKKDSRDFIYDDCIVDETDTFRHSKWISFMEKRLQLAYNLLSSDGVLFISIDEHEFANLKLLCDQIFDEKRTETYIWCLQDSTEGSFVKTSSNTVRKEHEYIIVCFKNTGIKFKKYLSKAIYDESKFSNPDNDERGVWFSGNISRNGIKTTTGSKYYTIKTPSGKEYSRNWTLSREEYQKALEDNRIFFPKNGEGVPRLKIFPSEAKEVIQSSLFTDVHTSITGKNELKELFDGESPFEFPKPSDLILRFIEIVKVKRNSVILDFFAGSGTTAEAVFKANRKMKTRLSFILCTNNQNNICRGITYERITRTIKAKQYLASLKYYKIDFVPINDKFYYEYADDLLKHIRELVELENGINFNGNSEIAIVLNDDEMDKFISLPNNNTKILYRGHNVLMTDEQEDFLKSHGIRVNVIPDYYYNELNK